MSGYLVREARGKNRYEYNVFARPAPGNYTTQKTVGAFARKKRGKACKNFPKKILKAVRALQDARELSTHQVRSIRGKAQGFPGRKIVVKGEKKEPVEKKKAAPKKKPSAKKPKASRTSVVAAGIKKRAVKRAVGAKPKVTVKRKASAPQLQVEVDADGDLVFTEAPVVREKKDKEKVPY